MWFFLKFFVTFPIFLFFFLKLFWKIFRKRKKSAIWKEQNHYLWVKRYSSYLLWLYGRKTLIKNQSFWNEKGGMVFVKEGSPISPLIFIKINDFSKQSPFSLFFSAEFKQNLNFLLKYFYSLINPFDIDSNFDSISKNLKIPRTMFVFFPTFQENQINFLINISKGSFVKIVILRKEALNNSSYWELDYKAEPEEIIKLNKQFIFAKIKESFQN